MEYRVLSFPVMIPSIERIDFENKIVYHQDVEEGQTVVNFVRMFHKQAPWEILLSHSKMDYEREIVEGWRREFLYPPLERGKLTQISMDVFIEKYKTECDG